MARRKLPSYLVDVIVGNAGKSRTRAEPKEAGERLSMSWLSLAPLPVPPEGKAASSLWSLSASRACAASSSVNVAVRRVDALGARDAVASSLRDTRSNLRSWPRNCRLLDGPMKCSRPVVSLMSPIGLSAQELFSWTWVEECLLSC